MISNAELAGPLHPKVEASDQIVDALADLDRHADDYLRWPWEALDALYGGLAPGTVHYVVGFSGMGKTTFIASALRRWRAAGRKIDVLPLELKANVFRTYLACQELNIDPGLMLSGDFWRESPDPAALRDAVKAQVQAQIHASEIRVRGAEHIDVGKLSQAVEDAADRGASALVVDHIDHITSGGAHQSQVEISMAVNEAALALAKRHNLLLILMSQANNDALKASRDHLSKFQPLRDTSVWMGAKKRHLSSGMLGLFRPIREPHEHEPKDEYAKAIKRARDGEDAPGLALMPGVMGLSLMKSRNYGGREGQRVLLAVKQGQVTERAAALPYTLRRGGGV